MAAVDQDRVLDLTAMADDGGPDVLRGITDVGALLAAGPPAVEAARSVLGSAHGSAHTLDVADVLLDAPVLRPSKIICVGLNYTKHAHEAGLEPPARPILFPKWPNSLVGNGVPISDLGLTAELDYEAELAIVMGRRASRVSESEALDHVFGFTILNDVSARDLQHSDPGSQWSWGKALDGFAPLGPWVAAKEEIADWRELRLTTHVNGELRQDELCGDMVFGVEELVSWISRGVTLEPGDIIATGTPSGVGFGFTPPEYLVPGDLVEVSLTGVGTLVSPVVRSPHSPR
ncbi:MULTISPECIES: fumarylacetoacetate hydrolase family protein [unclassified Geodermatophilus]|uniref:fumarylacetoacetate hydrolase family protein n=1 Tax=unclassified Geodermatophilus TaxID=2637632 RepID=UPI003EEA372C